MSIRWISALCGGIVLSLLACDDAPKVIDPFPIDVDLTGGSTLLAASEGGGPAIAITLDVLSPVTVLDSFREGGELIDPKRRLVDLTLLGLDGDGAATIARVRFPESPAFDLHPCGRPGLPPTTCQVGVGEDTRAVFGVLGADILARSSVRFNFPDSQIFFFPDAAGSVTERSLACDAVFESPYSGGGTVLIGGSEIQYGKTRPTLGACIHHSGIEEPRLGDSEKGTNLHLAFSTAMGPTILTQSAYLRYQKTSAPPGSNSGIILPLEDLEAGTLHLLSGPVPVQFGELPYMAIVGEAGDDSDRRGPCQELYANARMREARSCTQAGVDCPCPDSRNTCKAAAAVEVNRSIQIAVVDDSLPLLQSLRDELRPSVPELDGIIGVDAMENLRVEFDFPNNRLLMRCLETEFCTTRPQVRSQNTLEALQRCAQLEDADRALSGQDAGPLR